MKEARLIEVFAKLRPRASFLIHPCNGTPIGSVLSLNALPAPVEPIVSSNTIERSIGGTGGGNASTELSVVDETPPI